MVCRLCLRDSEQYEKIFDTKGIEFNIVTLIRKYLYFEVTIDDTISTDICQSCSAHLEDFHKFYCRIEEAQNKLTEKFFIKEEEHFCDNDDDNSINSVNKSIQESNIKNDSLKNLNNKTLDEMKNEGIDANNDKEPLSKQDKEIEMLNKEIILTRKRGRPKKIALENSSKVTKAKGKIKKIPSINREKRKLALEELQGDQDNCNETQSETFNSCNSVEENEKNKKNKKEKTTEPSEYVKRCKEVNENIGKYMKMQCELCPTECPTFPKIRSHYREAHKCAGYVICCNKKFYRPGFLWEHINKHINPDYIRCELCDKTYADKKSLKTHHVIMHTPDEKKIHKCDICSKSFPKIYMLENHKLIHMPKEERKYICELCGKAFPSQSLLQSHTKQIHENAYGKMCHICGKVLQSKTLLAKHQLEHAGIVDPKVQCEECGAWLKDKYVLKKHMKRHREREEDLMNPKGYTCELCGKHSATREGLRGHMQYNHQMKSKYQCNICSKSFNRPKSLKEHMTTHTGEVLYTCPHCPKTFNSSANMHSHRKKKHRAEWEAKRKDKETLRETFKMNLAKKTDKKSTNEQSEIGEN